MTTKTAADYLSAAANDTTTRYGKHCPLPTRLIASATDRDRADSQYQQAMSAFAHVLGLVYEDTDEFFDAIEPRQSAMTDAENRAALRAAAELAQR